MTASGVRHTGLRRITGVTRSRIRDCLVSHGELGKWSGRLDETDFLERIYSLDEMESTDSRFPNAGGDIWQHRFNNHDWEDDWVFDDSRFRLKDGPDEFLLRFLAEMLHPEVRTETEQVNDLLKDLNELLRSDGYELYVSSRISGLAVFNWRDRKGFHDSAPDTLLANKPVLTDPAVLQEHLDRIKRTEESDPSAAIGHCKELVESLLRTILDQSGESYSPNDDLLKSFKQVSKLLDLNVDSVPENIKGSKASHSVLRSLATVIQGMAELRNVLGTGHGRTTKSRLERRHSRLALNTTVAVTEFLLDTWQQRIDSGNLTKS